MDFLASRESGCGEIVGEMLFVLSPEAIFRSLTPALQRLTGLDIVNWVGKSFLALLHRNEWARVQAAVLRLQSGEAEFLEGVRCLTVKDQFKALNLSFLPRFKGEKLLEIICVGARTEGAAAPLHLRC